MPTTQPNPVQRRARLAALIASERPWSQHELVGLLRRREGITVTQSTLSRDLAELGVVKGPAGYMLPGADPVRAPEDREAALASALRQHLVSVARAGTLVVVRTPPGHARSLAVELHRHGLAGVLGTIAGDDTIFIAARDAGAAGAIVRTLERLARSSG